LGVQSWREMTCKGTRTNRKKVEYHWIREPRWLSRYSDWLRAPRGRGSSPGRIKNFNFSISSRPAVEPTQHPIKRVPGALSQGLKWQGREADHSPPTSAEVKKTRTYTSTSPHVFMVYCLMKHRDNSTFTTRLCHPVFTSLESTAVILLQSKVASNKLRGFSSRANYTDRATAACTRS
jgi:hypothetical protein